jgi:hypothetical protein
MTRKLRWASLAVVGLASCANTYFYSPDNATVVRAGQPATVQKIPRSGPSQGKVEIASKGIVTTRASNGQDVHALHVRLIVDNEQSNVPWTLDTHQQWVLIESGNMRLTPIMVGSDLGALPTVQVARRERKTFDLFYPLPPGHDTADDLRAFVFQWQVGTEGGTVAGSTHINRMVEDIAYAGPPYYSWSPYWSPYWWYDPYYPGGYIVYSTPG